MNDDMRDLVEKLIRACIIEYGEDVIRVPKYVEPPVKPVSAKQVEELLKTSKTLKTLSSQINEIGLSVSALQDSNEYATRRHSTKLQNISTSLTDFSDEIRDKISADSKMHTSEYREIQEKVKKVGTSLLEVFKTSDFKHLQKLSKLNESQIKAIKNIEELKEQSKRQTDALLKSQQKETLVVEDVKTSLSELNKQNERETDALLKTQQAVGDVKTSLSELKKQNDRGTDALLQLQDYVENLANQNETSSDTQFELQKFVARDVQTIKESLDEMEETHSENMKRSLKLQSDLSSSVADVSKSILELKQQHGEDKVVVDAVNKSNEGLRKALNTMGNTVDTLNKKIEEAQQEKLKLRAKLATGKEEATELQASVKEKEAKVEEIEKEFKVLAEAFEESSDLNIKMSKIAKDTKQYIQAAVHNIDEEYEPEGIEFVDEDTEDDKGEKSEEDEEDEEYEPLELVMEDIINAFDHLKTLYANLTEKYKLLLT